MNTDAAYDLVFGADGAEQSLRQHGRFPESWLLNYNAALEFARESFDYESVWPKKLFQAFHYASTHLPLRYNVWTASSRSSNLETEQLLSGLQFDTEEYLWSSLHNIPRWSAPVPSSNASSLGEWELRLVDLCFGEESPLRELGDDESYHSWRDSYVQCLRESGPLWKKQDRSSKWLCMAVHFASFYIDLFQIRDIALTNNMPDDGSCDGRVEDVLAGLTTHFTNDNVLHLIRLWLNNCHVRRDTSGLPAIGKRRPRTGQYISVRTTTEVLLLEGTVVGSSG